MTIVEVNNECLDITLTAWDCVWTLKGHVCIPLSHVKGVEVQPRPRRSWKAVKFPGSYWPDKIQAGSYWSWDAHEWSFWNIRSGKNVVVIELESERHKQLILDVDDPERVVEMVKRAMG
jgi:hypothetical protein